MAVIIGIPCFPLLGMIAGRSSREPAFAPGSGQNSSAGSARFGRNKSAAGMDLFMLPDIGLLQHFAVERGGAMFVPFYSTMSLAIESCDVIGLRMMKMMWGGKGSHDEAQLMVTEKLNAMVEATTSLMTGGTASSVVDRYREHVAANVKRLSN
jgi:hypothetical protein